MKFRRRAGVDVESNSALFVCMMPHTASIQVRGIFTSSK